MKQGASTFTILKRFFSFLQPHWKLGISGGVLLVLNVLAQLPMPLVTMHLIDDVIVDRDFIRLHWIGVGLAVFLLFKVAATYYQTEIFIKFRNKVLLDIRSLVFNHVSRLPISFFEGNKAGYLSSRVSSELNALHSLMANTLLRGLMDLLTFLFGLFFLFWLQWKLALMAIALLPLHLLLIHRLNPKMRQLTKEKNELFSRVMGDILETFCCMYIVKAYLAENRELKKMLSSFTSALETDYQAAMTANILGVGASVVNSVGRLLLIWVGCFQIMNGDFTIGAFLAFNSFLRYLYDPAQNLMNLNTSVQQGVAVGQRLFELLDLEQEMENPKRTEELQVDKGMIQIRNLSFSYDQNEVLKDLNLTIPPGTTLAVVGPSGSGKSTLIKLLLGLYTHEHGIISIDGQDISRVSLSSLRKRISVIPQDTYLFTGDVWFNLGYGAPSATREQMIHAAKKANAFEFITNLPNGFETQIGERGVRLSGGQKQRLSIAMAILANAPILIMDEATSSLDRENEKAIQATFREISQNKTTIVIAHHLHTITHADEILVLDQGRVSAQGSHEELLETSSLYRRLFGNMKKESLEMAEI